MQKGWEHHAVHAAVWQRHLRIWTREYTGTREGCVCKRNQGWKRARVCECVCVCVDIFRLARLLVFLLRAVSPEGTEKPSPSSWTPSGHSPSNNGVSPTPSLIMQNLSLPQRHREQRQAVGSQTLAHPSPLTCFIWTLIYYYCWWKNYCSL